LLLECGDPAFFFAIAYVIRNVFRIDLSLLFATGHFSEV
jgi:hypothetical protein